MNQEWTCKLPKTDGPWWAYGEDAGLELVEIAGTYVYLMDSDPTPQLREYVKDQAITHWMQIERPEKP